MEQEKEEILKECILVEYYQDEKDEENTTYELFDNVIKAFKFSEKVKVRKIDLVLANNTYYEDNGVLNYEDFSNTIEKGILSTIY